MSSFEKGISVKLKAFKPGVALADIMDSVSSSMIGDGENSSVFLQLVIISVLIAHATIGLLHRNITLRFNIEC